MQKFSGRVIHGEKIGRTLGYPTANIDITAEALPLEAGVYASYVTVEGKQYQGALVILSTPWKVEVHIIDMPPHDLYGEMISLEVKQKVSDIIRFESVDALKKKISDDVLLIRKIFTE